ncbi:restriction endonuclease subunit R [Chloroflexota bacterium]
MREELISYLKQLKTDRRIDKFDEAATKQTVLLRILSLLGWDTFDIDAVKPEFAVGSQRVDYSLRKSGRNKVFIEVKKVGEDLEKHQEQLLNYSFKEGVKLAILTNGIAWRFYLPLHEGSWEQRKFYTIELYNQDINDIADRFISYLERENVVSEKAIINAEEVYKSKQKEYLIHDTLPVAWNKLISEPDELLIELIADATEKQCGYKPDNSTVEDFISNCVIRVSTLVEKSPNIEAVRKPISISQGSYIGKSISAFSFGNTRYEVRYWIEVLKHLSGIIYKLHQGDFERVLQLRGSLRPYFTKKADELRIPQQIEGSGIFMETNLSSNLMVRICIDMVRLFGYSERDFNVEAH